jgi:hypothetical protein
VNEDVPQCKTPSVIVSTPLLPLPSSCEFGTYSSSSRQTKPMTNERQLVDSQKKHKKHKKHKKIKK